MAIADWLREMPFVDDVVELAEIVAELIPIAATEGVDAGDYSELRDGMYWTVGEDGMTTRERLLAERSIEPVVRDESGRTISGLWRDAHTGFESRDPSDFDIDHRVPFKEIVDQFPQVYGLTKEEQLAIYSDPDNLQVTHDEHNREKGDATPAEHAREFVDAMGRGDFLRVCGDYLLGLRKRFGQGGS